MALKSATGKLYMLLSGCLPENTDVEKRLLLEQITESEEYRELEVYAPMGKIVNKLYSKNKLSEFSVNKLKGIQKAIPYIIPTVSKTITAIKYGNGWSLSSKDIPDFYSYDSLKKLESKLNTNDANANLTNISDNDFLGIFSDKVIRSINDIQSSLTVLDLEDIETAIKTKLSGKTYCINTNTLNEIKSKFDNTKNELDKYEKSIRYKKYKIVERKIFITALAILMMFGIGTSGLLHALSMEILIIATVIVAVIYWIKG